MGIQGQHNYRFVYLKSEEWKDVRVEALARVGAKCQICSFESISNDAHHIFYPKSFWDTKPDDLIILCRPCHKFIHDLEQAGIVHFKGERINCISGIQKIIRAISTWSFFIKNPEPITMASIKAEQDRAVSITTCCACNLPKPDCRKRQIPFSTCKPEDLTYKFCDNCFFTFINNLPKGIQAIAGKNRTYAAVGALVRGMVRAGKIIRAGKKKIRSAKSEIIKNL